jgi:hypothetical protein
MGTVIPFRRLGMIATCPSPARRRAQWLYRQHSASLDLIAAHWRLVETICTTWTKLPFLTGRASGQ